MAKPRVANPQRVDVEGGAYRGFPDRLFDSAAWKVDCDFRMQAIVIAVARHWNGFNNGSIGVSARELADAIGSHSYSSNSRALKRALDRGLLVCTRVYPKGCRKSWEFRLPWVTTGKHPNFQPATHEYRHWSPADGQGRKKCRSFVLPVAVTATDLLRSSLQGKERTVAVIATQQADSGPSPVAVIATPIISPLPHLSLLSEENTGGAIERPKSVTEDRWILAKRRAATNPTTPDVDFCRDLANAFLEGSGRGAQSRLARATGIPDASLSKFLHRDAPLAAHHRSRLVSAVVATGFTKGKAA